MSFTKYKYEAIGEQQTIELIKHDKLLMEFTTYLAKII